MTQPLDESATMKTTAQSALVELRGPSGKLYGMLDRQSLVIEFKAQRRGSGAVVEKETIDLKPYLELTRHG